MSRERTPARCGLFRRGRRARSLNRCRSFPKLPDSFFTDFTDSGPKATVQICVQAALTGAACPGVLKVSLPK